ncbi:MAG: response regulator [Phycisphaerae bacterium]|nr:response regulator [Phycisphaerae bacterium]
MSDELAGKSVLLVDDDRDILTAIQSALSDTGVTILTADDGDQAIIQAQEHSPDLIVLDMMLPKRSGFLVLEKLKRGKELTDPPRVIMITGNPGTRHKIYAESQGVDLYIHKPFRMEKLIESIKEMLTADR